MRSLVSYIKQNPLLLIFLAIYSSLLAYKLIVHHTPFYDWDESIYIQVGKEMVEKFSLIPLWQGEAWLEKPPLAPLLYGLIIKFIPFSPEITTRLFSLMLSNAVLVLLYEWVVRATKNRWVATAAVMITAINPIFLYRAQTVNTDSLLLIGWLGYFLTFPRLWVSLLFLSIGVMSKSLLGFYPLILFGAYYIFQFVTQRITKKVFITYLQLFGIQILILVSWYVLMLLMYKNEFISVHFSDHLVRRVTSSIESHFGKRTFYIDLVVEQYGPLLLLSIFPIIHLLKDFIKHKKIDAAFFVLFLLPWFIFLNLTKTKIHWYLYPALPQFGLLLSYWLIFIKNKLLLTILVVGIGVLALYHTVYNEKLLTTSYSSYDNTYKLATEAKKYCDSMTVLINKTDRNTREVLNSLKLSISTSLLYGTHPSYFYYFGKRITLLHKKQPFTEIEKSLSSGSCLVIDEEDIDIDPKKYRMALIKRFDKTYLYQKQ